MVALLLVLCDTDFLLPNMWCLMRTVDGLLRAQVVLLAALFSVIDCSADLIHLGSQVHVE